MGLLLGKIDGSTMVVMDSFALPVEGTETRVNAQAAAYEYMTEYIEAAKRVRGGEGDGRGRGGEGRGRGRRGRVEKGGEGRGTGGVEGRGREREGRGGEGEGRGGRGEGRGRVEKGGEGRGSEWEGRGRGGKGDSIRRR